MNMAEQSARFDLASDDVLLFLHIPKTAGLSMISLLEQQFKREEILELHSVPGQGRTEKSVVLEGLGMRSQELKQRIRLIRGHLSFGPYDTLIWRYIVQTPVVITLLRDPVERTISAYMHMRRNVVNNPGFQEKYPTILDWVKDPENAHRVVNRLTRQIVGAYFRGRRLSEGKGGLSDQALLSIAKQRLEQFPFVGLTERFQESMNLLHHTFGWDLPAEVPQINVSPTRISRFDFSSEEIEAIRERTNLDEDLYKAAEELFDRRWHAMQQKRSAASAGTD